MKQKNNKNDQPDSRRYKLVLTFLLLLFFIALSIIFLSQEPKSDPASEAAIRKAAAQQLGIDPNDLSDEDFAQITQLDLFISEKNQGDIKFLRKFTALRELTINSRPLSESEVPKWMAVLSKLKLYRLSKNYPIDLGPLKHLYNLQKIVIYGAPFKNVSSLYSLKNLKVLKLYGKQIRSIKSLEGLTYLQELVLEQVSSLQFFPEYKVLLLFQV